MAHGADSAGALAVDLAGVALRNPVMLAAGTAGYIDEMSGAMDLGGVGAVVTKSITAEAREGNLTWRVLETRGGMLNAIGLANVGAEAFGRDHAPRAAQAPTVIVGSVAGFSIGEYVAAARVMEGATGIPAVELNVSCPNVHSGTMFGDEAGPLALLVNAVRKELTKKLFVKLPPALSAAPGGSIVELARAALGAGADGLVLANTIPAMAIDVETRRPRLANVTGGLSGPAVHLAAVRLVHLVHKALSGATIIGAGGVTTWEDAAEFILAGATAVQMGTALFADPRAPGRVVKGLEEWVRRQGKRSVRELVGAVELPAGGLA